MRILGRCNTHCRAERDIDQAIAHLIQRVHLRDQYNVFNQAADTRSILIDVNHPRELAVLVPPGGGNPVEVAVFRTEYPAEGCGSIEKSFVIPLVGPAFPRRQDVDGVPAYAIGDLALDVVVHIEIQAQGRRPLA